MRSTTRRVAIAGVGLLVAGLLAGCSSSEIQRGAGDGISLTVGSSGDPELDVVGQLYGQALAADGFTVDYNDGVRSVSTTVASLKAGRIDIVPARLGEWVQTLEPTSDIADQASAVSALEGALAPDDLQPLDPSPARDGVVFVTSTQFAKAHGVDSLDDLTGYTDELVIGATSNFEDGDYGRDALENAYGISNWTLHENGTAQDVVDDLRSGRDDLAVMSTTDVAAYDTGIVHLEDPRGIIGPQYLVPVARQAIATGEVERVIQAVSSRLTSHDLARFAAASDAQLPETTAREWLIAQGLVQSDD